MNKTKMKVTRKKPKGKEDSLRELYRQTHRLLDGIVGFGGGSKVPTLMLKKVFYSHAKGCILLKNQEALFEAMSLLTKSSCERSKMSLSNALKTTMASVLLALANPKQEDIRSVKPKEIKRVVREIETLMKKAAKEQSADSIKSLMKAR